MTGEKIKVFIRENPTLKSVNKTELRNQYNEVYDRLKEFEDAEKSGMIIRLPVPLGTKLYELDIGDTSSCLGCEYHESGTTVINHGYDEMQYSCCTLTKNGSKLPECCAIKTIIFDKTNMFEMMKRIGKDVYADYNDAEKAREFKDGKPRRKDKEGWWRKLPLRYM